MTFKANRYRLNCLAYRRPKAIYNEGPSNSKARRILLVGDICLISTKATTLIAAKYPKGVT
jgi:hypothetical protein